MLGLGNSITGGAALEEFNVANVSGLVTWLKADTGITETSVGSGVVARWTDQTGSADWVSNQSGKQPALAGTGVNTYLDWDGGDRMYQKDTSWNTSDDGFDFDFPHDQFDEMNVGGSGGCSVFAVVQLDTANTLNRIFSVSHFADDGSPGAPFGSTRTDIVGSVNLNTGNPASGSSNDSFAIGGISGSATPFDTNSDVGDELPLDTKILLFGVSYLFCSFNSRFSD